MRECAWLINAEMQYNSYGSTFDIQMNTKWVHYDLCYYSEYQMN